MSRRLLAIVAAVAATVLVGGLVVTVSGRHGARGPDTAENVAARTVRPLPVDGTFDYQIGGPYTPAAGARVVDRDRTAAPVAGRYNICYVNAFQTQPDEASFWRTEHPDLLLHRGGRLLTDPGWPGEYLLDTSTAAKRAALLAIVGRWLDGCRAKGFSAVEPDNLDSWTRSHEMLDRADNLTMVTALARRAHADGLAIAQKNTLELGTAGRSTAHLDFAIAEECQVYRECDGYTKVYGDRVVEIEYTDNPASAYTEACRARGSRISVILRDRDVTPRGAEAYRYRSC